MVRTVCYNRVGYDRIAAWDPSSENNISPLTSESCAASWMLRRACAGDHSQCATPRYERDLCEHRHRRGTADRPTQQLNFFLSIPILDRR